MKCTSATCPERGSARTSRGFAAIVAIFILVVLAALGVVLVTISSAQHRESAFDSLGLQAYQSARAGIEFGLHQALRNASCAAATSFAMPGALSAFTVRVECASTAHTEVASTVNVYQITATACNRPVCPGTADATYVERQLRVVAGSTAP